jgi:hypothetical protein
MTSGDMFSMMSPIARRPIMPLKFKKNGEVLLRLSDS